MVDPVCLGVDPGSRQLGWCVLRRELRPRMGTLSSDAPERPARILELIDAVAEIFDEERPTVFVVETAWVPRDKPQAVLALAEIRGALLYLAGRFQVAKLMQMTPQQGKAALTGSGRASKDEMVRFARLRARLKADPSEHAADAFGLALCGWEWLGQSTDFATRRTGP